MERRDQTAMQAKNIPLQILQEWSLYVEADIVSQPSHGMTPAETKTAMILGVILDKYMI